jgi:hypothetical protein
VVNFKKINEKNLNIVCFHYMAFWKKKYSEDGKQINAGCGFDLGKTEQVSHRVFHEGIETTLYGILMVDE